MGARLAKPLTLWLAWLSLFAVSTCAGEDVWAPENFVVGAGLWGGHSWGHFQEVIYSSDPIEGFSGGMGLFLEWTPLDVRFGRLGVRGTFLETNYVPQPSFRLIQLDLNADLLLQAGVPDLAWAYGFAGATANVLNVKEKDASDDTAEYGLGFRYGGGAHARFTLDGRRTFRIGPEFVMGHAIYTRIIYHYSRLNVVFAVLFE